MRRYAPHTLGGTAYRCARDYQLPTLRALAFHGHDVLPTIHGQKTIAPLHSRSIGKAYFTKSGLRLFGFCPAGSTSKVDLTVF